jgi:hypothetical protein
MAEPIVEACPTCGADAVPVLYGLPTGEAFGAARDGKVQLGGCLAPVDDRVWECTADHSHSWVDGPRWQAAIDTIFDEYEARSRSRK